MKKKKLKKKKKKKKLKKKKKRKIKMKKDQIELKEHLLLKILEKKNYFNIIQSHLIKLKNHNVIQY